jgi:hypothetical protein
MRARASRYRHLYLSADEFSLTEKISYLLLHIAMNKLQLTLGFKFPVRSSLVQSVNVNKFQVTCARIVQGALQDHRLSIVEISHEVKDETQNLLRWWARGRGEGRI